MLDKSIPYKNIIMKRDGKEPPLPAPVLPEGYGLRFFQAGDETHWARIETAVGEFDTEEEALAYFKENYRIYPEELARRCLFATDPAGWPVGTANAWFARQRDGYWASLHWVAVIPEAQGLGLGRAVVLAAMNQFSLTDPERDVWLHTQTWSHKAVRMYHHMGFRMMKTARLLLSNKPDAQPAENDYAQALEILAQVEDGAFIKELAENAE